LKQAPITQLYPNIYKIEINQGIASKMISLLLEKLPGQHVCLFTDDALDFYKKLGFTERGTCMEKVIGKWLVNLGS
jgi:hypothetical protein